MRVVFYSKDESRDPVSAQVLSLMRHWALHYPQDKLLLLTHSKTDLDSAGPVAVHRLAPRYRLFPFWSDRCFSRVLRQFDPEGLISAVPRTASFLSRPLSVGILGPGDPLFDSLAPLPDPVLGVLDTELKWQIKEEYTQGREYFMATGPFDSEHQLLTLLQAFSVFKNRMQSGLRLLLPIAADRQFPALVKKLQTYKYRKDLVLTGTLTAGRRARLMAAAYALICTAPAAWARTVAAASLRVAVPLLTLQDDSVNAVSAGAALYASDPGKDALAQLMMRIYKDESLRTQLIVWGAERHDSIDPGQQLSILRQTLLQARASLV